MKLVVNQKLIQRNAKIGKYATLAALVVLLAGFVVTLQRSDLFNLALFALFLGFVLSQIGAYFTNRWGRSPRLDEILTRSMKGLGREYTLYHYVTPTPHLLVGPAGVWTLLPYYQGGKIIFDGKRWKAKGGGFVRAYLRVFGQESLGRPDRDAQLEVQTVERYLKRLLPEATSLPPVRAVLVFTDPSVELHVENSPVPAITSKALKDFLKAQAAQQPLPASVLATLRQALPQPERED
ncbi:MAG: hypothetical protein N2049_07135 [Anaerolineales bacterium]|nr:hypothetical protein [Anaerolineales bacterium]MCX7608975.1 hypothetical protein [Anaerolineales bacterium]